MRAFLTFAKWVALTVFGVVAVTIVLGLGGTKVPWSATDVSGQKPYVDFIGREYRVIADVGAHAWNDFPDKDKILSISLVPHPGVRNRFVSYVIPVKRDQRIRLISAWRHFVILGFNRRYVVSLPDAGLPKDVPIHISMRADGTLDPLAYELIGK
jgi:hypothetical protein